MESRFDICRFKKGYLEPAGFSFSTKSHLWADEIYEVTCDFGFVRISLRGHLKRKQTLTSMTALALLNALATNEQLEQSPSQRDGIKKETEKILLSFGCELIQSAGIALKL